MASAKQIKARKLFARKSKRGDFRKAISKTKKAKTKQQDYQSGEGLEKKLREYGIKKALFWSCLNIAMFNSFLMRHAK